ncbi:MAG TPA: DMT family transporter [Candidatus Angelobacter sp.]|nr:DMT family transporter [Candidatus Angelobacter sp.]
MGLGFIHNGIIIAVIAHGLIGASLVWDKVLLRRPHTSSLLSYVFWLGSLSCLSLCLIPFGFHIPEWQTAVLAFGTGLLHQVAICFYYMALKRGEASQTLAIMGGFSPVATVLIAVALLNHPLNGSGTVLGFALLVAGGFMMFFSEPLDLHKVLPSVLMASGSFGLVNVLQKLAFKESNFVTAYVIFCFGQFMGSLALLIRPAWRREIFEQSEQAEPKSRFWYFVNRFISGVGSFLVFYAISLSSPALVDAITGLRYVIIFAGAYAITVWRPQWLRENFTGRALVGKVIATGLVLAGLVVLGLHSGASGSPAAANHRELPLQKGHATSNQGRRQPSPPIDLFMEHMLGQESLQYVGERSGRNGKAYVGNGEQ